MDQTRRYNVKVQFRKIDDFAEARREMRRAEALKMYMPCTIKTDEVGQKLHSVALCGCVGLQDKMEALNSWGAKDVYMDVTPENFVDAITFDVIITGGRHGDTGMHLKPLPKPRDTYNEREAMYTAQLKEELDKAEKAKKEERDRMAHELQQATTRAKEADKLAQESEDAAATAASEEQAAQLAWEAARKKGQQTKEALGDAKRKCSDAAAAVKRAQDKLAQTILGIITDEDVKKKMTQVVSDLVHSKVATVKWSELPEQNVSLSCESATALAESIACSSSLTSLDLYSECNNARARV